MSNAIHFVNHASYIHRANGVQLLCDPWLTGDAFDHGWSLLAPTQTSPEEIARTTHIWISHEHPDHFAPAFFKTIPAERRPEMTVLYQETKDRKVADFLRKMGFEVKELPPRHWEKLADGFEVRIEPVPMGDSMLLTRAGGITTVNLNDCAHTGRREFDLVDIPVDVLFTQFGYASWQGAPSDTPLRKELAKAQLVRITQQVEAIRPKYVVPFASFAYFSAPENAYLNDAQNTVAVAHAHIEKLGVKAVVMYPGDEWNVGDAWDNTKALARWAPHYASLATKHVPTTVPLEKLREHAQDYMTRMRTFHPERVLKLAHSLRLGLFGPIDIYVSDLELAIRFDLFNGLSTTAKRPDQCAATMHSESVAFLFRFDYGLNTLSVNGRFVSDTSGFKRMVRAFGLGTLKNDGRRFSPALLGDRMIWKAAQRAIFRRRY